MSKNRIAVGALIAFALLVAGVAFVKVRSGTNTVVVRGPGPNKSAQPNVLMIMTDDQTLASMKVMANTKRLVADEGTTFNNYFVSFPNCCPSRATYLTGQFAHNNGVLDNLPPYGGAAKLKGNEILPVWLQRAGYDTTSIGKYLNTWGSDGNIAAPPGWNHWFGLIDPTTYQYFGYSVSVDGARVDFGSKAEDYQTDVLGTEVVKTITDRGKLDQPWFVSWTPLAPHAQHPENEDTAALSKDGTFRWAMAKPPARFENKLTGESAPRPPSFNEADVSAKSTEIRDHKQFGSNLEKLIDQGYRQELESLLAVDEWVGKIIDTLRQTGQLDNTVVMFTSDNGFYHGEHRLAFVKVFLYEEAVHVPFVARGGPFTKGATVDAVTGNVDLASTILKLAGAASPLQLDGLDMGALAKDPGAGQGRAMLLENLTAKGASHSEGLRTDQYKYIQNELGEVELYDIKADPYEMTNLARDPAMTKLRDELSARLTKMKACKGAGCEKG